MSPWLRVVALSAIVSVVASGCKSRDDDEDPREHRKHRVGAGATTGSGGGVSLSCPFGLCGGSGGGPQHLCDRMMEIMSNETGPLHGPPPEKSLDECAAQMEKMQRDEPKQYALLERCVETASDMNTLVTCMTKMYLDGGVP